MIYQKGDMWAIRGYSQKYFTLEEATTAYQKMFAKEEAAKVKAIMELKKVLEKLHPEPTPYEVMIQKNVCKVCNLEPCECFTSIEKTERGY
jgi:hypothetical protein